MIKNITPDTRQSLSRPHPMSRSPCHAVPAPGSHCTPDLSGEGVRVVTWSPRCTELLGPDLECYWCGQCDCGPAWASPGLPAVEAVLRPRLCWAQSGLASKLQTFPGPDTRVVSHSQQLSCARQRPLLRVYCPHYGIPIPWCSVN